MDVDDSGDYDYRYRHLTFQITGAALRPTMLPLLRLKFNFSFKIETSNWILTRDSRAPEFAGEAPSLDRNTSVAVTVGEALSYDDKPAAVGEAAGDLLTVEERHQLVEIAWSEACRNFPAARTLPMFGTLNLDLGVRVERRQIVVVRGGDDPGLVPAADSSLEMLEKCDPVDSMSCCCICLEKLGGGGGAARVPCSHVFHGGCIEKWLRSSHYCPLCRYEMPAAENLDEFEQDDFAMLMEMSFQR